MINFNVVRPGRTLYIPFESFAGSTGAPVTITGLAVSDIRIYKDGSTTERASTSGYTLLDTDGIDFDGITGIHGFSINLADDATADFFKAGSQYWVIISAITVDGVATMSFIAATFRIGYHDSLIDTFIATLAGQTLFTLSSGPAEDDAIKGYEVIIHDKASAVQLARGIVQAYTGSTKTVLLTSAAPTFTIAAGDNISVMGPSPLQPTEVGRTVDVTTGGEVGIDWANVGSPTTTRNLSGTTVKTATDVETDTQDLQARIPAALTAGGNMKADALALSGDTTAADNAEAFFDGTGYAGTNNVIPLVTTATNLTNAPTAGDFTATMKASINTEADTALADVGATSARMGYVDNLNISGNVASSAEVTSIQNNTRVVRVVPDVIERPDSGTTAYRIELLLYDDVGNMEAPDSAPTIALVNQAGTDRSARLDSTTMALVSTGRYRAVYTADPADTLEQLVWSFSVVEGGNTRLYGNTSLIVDTSAVDFTAADRTKLEAVHAKLPSKTYITGTANSDGDIQLDEATGALAKGTGITGFNDLSAGQVNAEADTALADVGLTTTVTGRIDAAISSRMATYTQPSGFLAATFPSGTIANTTNITGGVITTVTNLTNAPTVGDFTAVMKTSLNAATPAVTVSDKTGFSLAPTGLDLVMVAGKTLPNAVKFIGASAAGVVSGAGSGIETFKDFAGVTALTITVDASGNRTAVVYAA
jgi:hypothetical protein